MLRAGAVQPGEEKAVGSAESGLSVSNGGCKKKGDRLMSRVGCDGKKGNGFKLKEGRFRLNIRRKFFTIRVVRHRMPREVVGAPSLQTPKVRLDGALST